jgi:2-polyprenyl-3-methyl-5-hydroxy-6-metoxy-1,4-benzoquinol methylase
MIIIPENTAIVTGVARSTLEVQNYLPTGSSLLDYGAGKLRNAFYLQKQGYHVSILETPLQLKRIHQQYNLSAFLHLYETKDDISETFQAVVCSFVLNVVPSSSIRSNILTHIHSLLTPKGKVFVEVRKSKGILGTKYHEPYEDGYAIGKGKTKTFQKPFEKQEIVNYVEQHGFQILQVHSTSDSWCVVAQKN